jgi:hypothetical protein
MKTSVSCDETQVGPLQGNQTKQDQLSSSNPIALVDCNTALQKSLLALFTTLERPLANTPYSAINQPIHELESVRPSLLKLQRYPTFGEGT